MYLQSVFIYGIFKIQTLKKMFKTRFQKWFERGTRTIQGEISHEESKGGRHILLLVCEEEDLYVTPSEFVISSLISSLHPHWSSSHCQHTSFQLKCYRCLPLMPHQLCVLQEDVINTQCGYDVRAKPVSLVLVWRYTPSISVSSAFCTSPACFWETIYHRHNSQSKGPSGWPVIHSYTKSFKRLSCKYACI